MKIAIFTVLLSLFFVSCSGPRIIPSIDEKGKLVITGKMSWEEWKTITSWEDTDANKFHIDTTKFALFKTILDAEQVHLKIFAGSWCGDSKQELPKVFYILKKINFDTNRVELYGVDRDKLEQNAVAEEYNILKVPTVVVIKNGKETGRIVEFPQSDWVDDILSNIK